MEHIMNISPRTTQLLAAGKRQERKSVMASILLYALFTAAAVLALASTAHSLWRFGGEALSLPARLRECPSGGELRWTVSEHTRPFAGASAVRGEFRPGPDRRTIVRPASAHPVSGHPVRRPVLRAAA